MLFAAGFCSFWFALFALFALFVCLLALFVCLLALFVCLLACLFACLLACLFACLLVCVFLLYREQGSCYECEVAKKEHTHNMGIVNFPRTATSSHHKAILQSMFDTVNGPNLAHQLSYDGGFSHYLPRVKRTRKPFGAMGTPYESKVAKNPK